jgi:hypothetical protein
VTQLYWNSVTTFQLNRSLSTSTTTWLMMVSINSRTGFPLEFNFGWNCKVVHDRSHGAHSATVSSFHWKKTDDVTLAVSICGITSVFDHLVYSILNWVRCVTVAQAEFNDHIVSVRARIVDLFLHEIMIFLGFGQRPRVTLVERVLWIQKRLVV